MDTARADYKAFTSYYPTLEKNLKASLRQATEAQNKGSKFDQSRYKSYKEILQEQYNDHVVPIVTLQMRYPIVKGIGDQNAKDLKTWRTEVEQKHNELKNVVASVDKIVSKLKPSQLTANEYLRTYEDLLRWHVTHDNVLL